MITLKELFPEMRSFERMKFGVYLNKRKVLADGKVPETIEVNAYDESRANELIQHAIGYINNGKKP